MDRTERVRAQRQLQLGRQRVGQEPSVLCKRRTRELAQTRCRHSLARRVHRREVGRRARGADVVALDVEAIAPEPPTEAQVRTRRKLVCQPRLVEPRGADRSGLVLHTRRHDRPPAADPAGTDIDDLACDRDLVVAPELRDRDLVDSALVPARAMQEQVADGHDAERAQVLRERRADAGKCRDAEPVEPFGGPEPRGLGHSFWTTPAKPGCIRVKVATSCSGGYWRRRRAIAGRASEPSIRTRTGRHG